MECITVAECEDIALVLSSHVPYKSHFIAIMILRVYALLGRNLLVAGGLMLLWLVQVVLSIIYVTEDPGEFSEDSGLSVISLTQFIARVLPPGFKGM